MKNQEEKKQWILDYMFDPAHKNELFDIIAEPFVNAYVDKFDTTIVEWYPYGAPRVPEIGKLLSLLYKEGKVWRYRQYCKIWQDGYPRWFYVYNLRSSMNCEEVECAPPYGDKEDCEFYDKGTCNGN